MRLLPIHFYTTTPLLPDLLEAYNIYLYAIIVVSVLGNDVILIVFYKFRPATSNERFISHRRVWFSVVRV